MSLLAGAACVSIGPRPDDLRDGVWLGGFGSFRERRATAVHDEPQARALALSDGATTFVLAALDLIGASGPLLASIREDAARLTDVPPEHILIACTHSHASPDTQGLWGGIGDAYRTHIAHRAASAIWEAHRALAPAQASAASTQLHGVTKNRRGWPETDDALTTLRFASPEGAPIATLMNFACHPTSSGSSNTEVSRDWCGYAVDAVERETGGVAIYVNGVLSGTLAASGAVDLSSEPIVIGRNVVNATGFQGAIDEVAVFNRSKAKAEDLIARGARWAASPAEAADGADAVVTMVADDEASRSS